MFKLYKIYLYISIMWKIMMILCILCIVTTSIASKVSYTDYELISVVPKTNTDLRILKEIQYDTRVITFWQEPSFLNREVLFMVAFEAVNRINRLMENYNINYEIKTYNVENLIAASNRSENIKMQSSDFFDYYHSLEEIYNNLEELAQKYPTKVTIIVGGHTYEGRDIKGVKVFSDENKSGVFLEGGIHANEWISPATVMYILHKLLTSNDPNVRYVADNHNWFIFPVVNPDGYVYSHETDRLWRKNRKPSNTSSDRIDKDGHPIPCIGTDLNRNWDSKWNTTNAYNDPCAYNYAGSEPFSEIETKSLSQFINSIQEEFNSYISFHGSFQRLMFPENATDLRIFCYDELYYISSIAVKALQQKYNTQYEFGCINEFQQLSGLSTDYVAGALNKKIVFTYKLRDKGQYGYLLPPEQIIPTGQETLDSFVALFKALSEGHV